MASRIFVLNHYRPRVDYAGMADWHDVAEYIEGISTVSSIDIIAVLMGLERAVVHFNQQGCGVKLEGLGTYLPNINYDGEFDVAHRLDRKLKRELNNGEFSGKIRNRQHIGKTPAQIYALWDSEHPENPVE